MRSYAMHKQEQLTLNDTIDASSLFDSGCRRRSTADFHYHAIKRAITLMHERFAEPLTLQDLADAAQLSQFHFNRLFLRATGLPPTVFLGAIRLQQAKHLLMTTNDSVTCICFDVGYRSLGTFTSRFTSLVGLPPSHYRRLLDDQAMYRRPLDIHDNLHMYIKQQEQQFHPQEKGCISGVVRSTSSEPGIIIVGLFASSLPQGAPVSCAILDRPGYFTLPPVADGPYYLFAAHVDATQSLLSSIIAGVTLHGSNGRHPIKLKHGLMKDLVHLTITPTTWLHPPILTTLPWLFLSQFG